VSSHDFCNKICQKRKSVTVVAAVKLFTRSKQETAADQIVARHSIPTRGFGDINERLPVAQSPVVLRDVRK
jgi:undecaprenyl pyrophosphate synthase